MADGAVVVGIIFAILLAIVLMVTAKKAIIRVRHAQVVILERFGQYKATLTPGIYWVWPFIESPRAIDWRYKDINFIKRTRETHIDMREHVIDCGLQHIITLDNVQLNIDALVYFRVADPRIAVYQIENMPDAVELLTQSTLRDIMAKMTLDDTFSSREGINSQLLARIQGDCERWGVTITRVEIFDIMPPADIQNAMERQIKSERERRSTVLTADGDREAAVIRSRGEGAKMVLDAESARAAAVLRAEGKAVAKKMVAEAEAASINDIRAAVESSGLRGVDYLFAVSYLNQLASNTAGSKVILLPHEAVEQAGGIFKLEADRDA